MRFLSVLLLILALWPLGAPAAIHVLNPEGTGDFPTIQAALDGAAPGDTIALANGTYTGLPQNGLSYNGKALTLRSQSGNADSCILDAEGHIAFVFISGEGRDSILEEVTVCNANGPLFFSPLRIIEASPTIRWCSFRDNHAEAGGAMYIANAIDAPVAAPLIEACHIYNNWTNVYWGGGGGIWSDGHSRPEIVGCLIENNQAGVFSGQGGGIDCSSALIQGCVIRYNSTGGAGGGIYGIGEVEIINCEIYGNEAGDMGGGIRITSFDPSLLHFITGCSIVGNTAPQGAGVILKGTSPGPLYISNTVIAFNGPGEGLYCTASYWPISLSCSNLYGNEGGDWIFPLSDQQQAYGNLWADPLFCDLERFDLSLFSHSPCLPENNDCELLIGALGQGCEATAVVPGMAAPGLLLLPNQPNPFNPATMLRFVLAEAGPVRLAIYDLTGRRVRALLAGEVLEAGEHARHWDGRDAAGRALPSGLYLCRLEAKGRVATGKLSLLK